MVMNTLENQKHMIGVKNMYNVFVYGTLMKRHCNHDFLKNQRFVGKGLLKGYKMYQVFTFPGIVKSDQEEDVIIGEVYEIDEKTLKNLDRLEREGYLYKRIKENIILEDDNKLEAFVYEWLGSIRGAEQINIEDMPWEPKGG